MLQTLLMHEQPKDHLAPRGLVPSDLLVRRLVSVRSTNDQLESIVRDRPERIMHATADRLASSCWAAALPGTTVRRAEALAVACVTRHFFLVTNDHDSRAHGLLRIRPHEAGEEAARSFCSGLMYWQQATASPAGPIE